MTNNQKFNNLFQKINIQSFRSLCNTSRELTPKKTDSNRKESESDVKLATVANFDDFKSVMDDLKEHFNANYSQFHDDISINCKILNQNLKEYFELDNRIEIMALRHKDSLELDSLLKTSKRREFQRNVEELKNNPFIFDSLLVKIKKDLGR